MRRYESVWVVNGDLPDDEVKAANDKFSRIISASGGTLVGLDEWGRRKLAYRIQGTTRGYYVAADFAGEPATVKELERNYRIDDRIIRYFTIKTADWVNLEELQAEIENRARAAIPAEAETSSAPETFVPEASEPAAATPTPEPEEPAQSGAEPPSPAKEE